MPRFAKGEKPLQNYNFELANLIEENYFGETWKTKYVDQNTNQDLILKLIFNPSSIKVLNLNIADFFSTKKKLNQINGTVEFRNIYIQSNLIAIESEPVDGGNLYELINFNSKSKMDDTLIASCMHNIFLIVGKAHSLGLIHGNLNPGNILITKNKKIKISDFWLSEFLSRNRKNNQENQQDENRHKNSSPKDDFYISPQQKTTSNIPSKQDDTYALGVIWLQLAFGDPNIIPTPGSAWKKKLIDRGIKEQQINFIEKCIEYSPNDRPNDLIEFSKNIKNYIGINKEKNTSISLSSDIELKYHPNDNAGTKNDIFISYRADYSKDLASYLYKLLKDEKYRVFFDQHELSSGRWDENLVENVSNSKDFILILDNRTLENCVEPEDWVLKEILEAQKHKKNIVPVYHNDATPESISIPKILVWLKFHQGVRWIAGHELSCFDKIQKKLTAKKFTYFKLISDYTALIFHKTFCVIADFFSFSKTKIPNGKNLESPVDSVFINSLMSKAKKPIAVTTFFVLILSFTYLSLIYVLPFLKFDFDFDNIKYSNIPEKNYNKSWVIFKELDSLKTNGLYDCITGFSDDVIFISTKSNEIIKIENKKARIIFNSPSEETDYFSNIRVVDKDNAVFASFKDDTAFWWHIKSTGVEKVKFQSKVEKENWYSKRSLLKYNFNKFGVVDKAKIHILENYSASSLPITPIDTKAPLNSEKYKIHLKNIYPSKYAEVQYQLGNPDFNNYDFLWTNFQGYSFFSSFSSVFKKNENIRIFDINGKIENIRIEDPDNTKSNFFVFGSSKEKFLIISPKGKLYKRMNDKFEVISDSLDNKFGEDLIDVWVSYNGNIYGLTKSKLYILEPTSQKNNEPIKKNN